MSRLALDIMFFFFLTGSRYYVVAETGCNWYHLDINIFPLSKKSLSAILLYCAGPSINIEDA
jgi:hypothetical protein